MTERKEREVIKIKQFEWYEVQTRVRQIMGELLQPFNKKQTQQTIKMNQVKRNVAVIFKKIEDHDFILERENATKPTYIELQDKKIDEMQKFIHLNNTETDVKIKKMQSVVEIYQQKIKQLNSLEKRLDNQIFQRTDQFNKLSKNLNEQASILMKKQQAHLDDMSSYKTSVKGSLNKFQLKLISFDNRLRDLEDDSKRKGNDINRMLTDNLNHNEKIIKLELKALDLTERIQDRQKDTKLSEKFFVKVKEVQNDLTFINNYLESYQPLYTQIIVSDTLNSFVEGRSRRKLCIYQEQKYAQLHRHILYNEKRSLEELMNDYSHRIRKLTNRNKKYIINLKVKQSIKYGSNVYEFRVEDINDEVKQDKKAVSLEVPKDDINSAIEEKWEILEKELRFIVKNQITPTKKWIEELQQQSTMRSLEFDKKYMSVVKQIDKMTVKINMQQKEFSQQIAKLERSSIQQENAVGISRQYMKDILNFGSVLNHIVIQDQIDRQGTALYALKSKSLSQQPVHPTIQLDSNCMNCQTKNSGIINQAFKIACLSYNPSQIRIDDNLYSRQEILEISTNILDKLKKKIDTIYGFERSTIHVQKDIDSKKISEPKKKSHSLIKNHYLAARASNYDGSKSKEMQTLLPILGSTRQKKQRKTHISVFY